MKIGYSSHGVLCRLSEILKLEQERENATTDCIIDFLNRHPSKKTSKAIWITEDPFLCFKMYFLSAEYNNYKDCDINIKFYNWYDDIHAIDLFNMQLVCSDEQGGYLYCE